MLITDSNPEGTVCLKWVIERWKCGVSHVFVLMGGIQLCFSAAQDAMYTLQSTGTLQNNIG